MMRFRIIAIAAALAVTAAAAAHAGTTHKSGGIDALRFNGLSSTVLAAQTAAVATLNGVAVESVALPAERVR